MIIETAKSNTNICVILITLFICWECGRVTQYFPTPFPIHTGLSRAGQARIQRREQAQFGKLRLESPGGAASLFCHRAPPSASSLKNLDHRLRNDLPSAFSAANVSPNKYKHTPTHTHTHTHLQVASKCPGKGAAGKLVHT